MHVKRIPGGALRILLSDRELMRFGTSFEKLREQDPRTKTVIKRILGVACARAALPPHTVISVEAIPTDGGCLLLVTPHSIPATQDVYIAALENDSDLLSLATGMRQQAPSADVLASSLYEWESGYRLLLYTAKLPSRQLGVLEEFAAVTATDRIQAAKIAEFGKPVYVGDALERLSQLTV